MKERWRRWFWGTFIAMVTVVSFVQPTLIHANESSVVKLSTEDQVLEGMGSHATFYYDVPPAGVQESALLHLHLQYSELLQEGSTITVLVDDLPLYSQALPLGQRALNVDVPLTGKALSSGFHTVKVAFYGQISEELCTNVENPANWLLISATSHLVWQTQETTERKNMLQMFPYPFVAHQPDQPVPSKVVLPDQPSAEILTAAIKLTDYLNRQTNSEQPISIVRESEVGEVATHLIALGGRDQWNGTMQQWFQTADVAVKDEELVVSNYVVGAEQDTKQIMFITALEEQTIADKIAVLTHEHFRDQLSGDKLVINQMPDLPKNEEVERHVFRKMGIENQTLTGAQSLSSSYFYSLPNYVDVAQDGMLHLKLRASKTLIDQQKDKADDAELVVFINDIPHSVLINEQEQENEATFFDVAIPIEAEIVEKSPYVTLQFGANGLSKQEICAPPEDEKWIFVHEDSYIQWSTIQNQERMDFQAWPDPFVTHNGMEETILLLPDEYSIPFINQLQMLLSTPGSPDSLEHVQVRFEKDTEKADLKGKHVIVFGDVKQHPQLLEYQDQLQVPYGEKGLDLSSFQFMNETSKNVAWLQPSVWDDSKRMAVFAPVHEGAADAFSIKGLVDYMNTNNIDTDLIVESENGQIFTQKMNKPSEAGSTSATSKENRTTAIPWILFAVITIVGVGLFIYLYRRKKKV